MNELRRSAGRTWPFAFLAIALLAGAYVAAYFSLSSVRAIPGSNGADARHFSSQAALSFFRPMTWVESRFIEERRFGYRSR